MNQSDGFKVVDLDARRRQTINLLERAGAVGKVKHSDYAEFTEILTQRKKVGDDWVNEENLYMCVDGRIAMAIRDHALQGARLVFLEPKIIADNDDTLTLQTTIESSVYGSRTALATSRKKTGTVAERDFPWEVAQTSSVGRALGMFGYGIIPGAGLANAEDMERSETVSNPAPRRKSSGSADAFFAWTDGKGIPRSRAAKVLNDHKADFSAAKKTLEEK